MDTTTETTAPAKRAPRKTGKKAAKPSGKTPLKTICGPLKMDPKAARRKLRKAGFTWHDKRDRWTFTDAQAAKAKEILRPAN